MSGENLPLILAILAIGLASAEAIHPFGLRVPPAFLVVIAFLLAMRWAMRRQKRILREKLKEVPQHPLGLADDTDQRA